MSIPQELRYAQSHEWIRLEADGTATIGITDHAQEALGDIVFLELPTVGKQFNAGDACAVVESVKAASDIYAPISGEIISINENLSSSPEDVNANAYEAWLFKIKPTDASQVGSMLDADAYAKLIGV